MTRQSFREIAEWWEPEDIATALEYLDEQNDAAKDAARGRR